MPTSSNGYSTSSYAESTGTRLNVWKMKPMFRARKSDTASSESAAMSAPQTSMAPLLGASMQPMMLRSVVLPLPDAPTTTEKR